MESKEFGEVSRTAELNSMPLQDSGGNTPENQNLGNPHLAVDISQSAAIEEPQRVHLRESTEPGEPRSRIRLILDLV